MYLGILSKFQNFTIIGQRLRSQDLIFGFFTIAR